MVPNSCHHHLVFWHGGCGGVTEDHGNKMVVQAIVDAITNVPIAKKLLSSILICCAGNVRCRRPRALKLLGTPSDIPPPIKANTLFASFLSVLQYICNKLQNGADLYLANYSTIFATKYDAIAQLFVLFILAQFKALPRAFIKETPKRYRLAPGYNLFKSFCFFVWATYQACPASIPT
jgi:hypothetical protein